MRVSVVGSERNKRKKNCESEKVEGESKHWLYNRANWASVVDWLAKIKELSGIPSLAIFVRTISTYLTHVVPSKYYV